MSLANLLYICVAVILPILPAYLLYRLLPSESQVEGPWQGMRIKLGGAFGGYFLLVITIFGFAKVFPTYEVWSVSGRINLSDGQDVTAARMVTFELIPSRVAVYPDGSFDLSVFAVPDQSGVPQLPVLVVQHAGYRPSEPVRLEDESRVRKHALRKRLELVETVVLKPDPSASSEHQ